MSGLLTAHNLKPTTIAISTNPLSLDTYYVCTAAGSTTQTLPAATGSGKIIILENMGTGTATVSRSVTDTINGATSVTVSPYNRISVKDYAIGIWSLQTSLTNASQTFSGTKTFDDSAIFNSSVSVDTINEKTSANGVLIDGVRCKDSNIIGNRIVMSQLQSLSFTGGLGQTFDTGLPINMGGGGGTALVLYSINTSNGANTQSGIGYIKFYYDGNNLPTLTTISGNIYLTLSASGSNTLVLTTNVGGNSYTTLLLNK